MLLRILVTCLSIWLLILEFVFFKECDNLSLKIKNCEEEIENIKNELNKKQENYSGNLKTERKIPVEIDDILSVSIVDKHNGNVIISFEGSEIKNTETAIIQEEDL